MVEDPLTAVEFYLVFASRKDRENLNLRSSAFHAPVQPSSLRADRNQDGFDGSIRWRQRPMHCNVSQAFWLLPRSR